MTKINHEGRELIKRFESLRLIPYICPAGIVTVGWGHTGKDIVKGKKYTKDECEEILSKDLSYFERGVNMLLKCSLNDNQFSALVSFCFNLGVSGLKNSTLLRRLNDNENPNIVSRAEMIKYKYVTLTDKNGKKYKKELKGLLSRRLAEIALFTKVMDD